MQIEFLGKFSLNSRDLIRRCGYGEVRSRPQVGTKPPVASGGKLPSIRDRIVGRVSEVSYVRRLGGGEYPRFHVYIDFLGGGFRLNLHLDQKQASYEGTTAHSGEYDGVLVEEEGKRIREIINNC